MAPTLSVVVPTLNSETYLPFTLAALRYQSGPSIEILVVDSGSKDSTQEICREARLEPLYAPPGNMYQAINVGLQHATGTWCTYLNSDDLVFRDGYARLIEQGEHQRADVVYGNCDFIDGDNRFLFSFRAPGLSLIGPILHAGIMPFAQPATILRRSCLTEPVFDCRYRLIADRDLFTRLHATGLKFSRVEGRSVVAFRIHGAQLSHTDLSGVARERAMSRSTRSKYDVRRSWLAVAGWRLSNFPEYAVRLIRRYRDSGELSLRFDVH